MQEDLNKAGQAAPVQAKKASKLGINKDVQSQAGIPIPAPIKLDARTPMYPNAYEFPIAKLVKVHFDPAKEVKRDGEIQHTPVLMFVFVTKENKQFTNIIFPIDMDDDKLADKVGVMQQTIKHIFDATVGSENFVEDSMEGDTFAELFENVAKAFNSITITRGEGELAKTSPVFLNSNCYLKLTYYKTNLQFPRFPNFIQNVVNKKGEQVPCELMVNPTYDNLVPQEKVIAAPYGGGASAGAFGGGNFGDFPIIPGA